MSQFLNFLQTFLTQFAGGPGPPENNLVRFGLPALFWLLLLIVAWSRQRQDKLPREKWLIWGFGLGFFRELFMLGNVSLQMMQVPMSDMLCSFLEPFEHTLALASVLVIAGSFLRYILDDASTARRYILTGLGTTVGAYLIITIWWQKQLSINPVTKFHETWPASFMHLLASIMILVAIFILVKKGGWLRNVVAVALLFLFLGEFLFLINYATGRVYGEILCPIGNSFHIWAIPLFGFVYFREQSIEKKRADNALKSYREHLEELVAARTSELTRSNRQLEREIKVRVETELEIAQRNAELSAQNAIAATLSQSLGLNTMLNAALERTLSVLGVEAGCIYLIDPVDESKVSQVYLRDAKLEGTRPSCLCQKIAQKAMTQHQLIIINLSDKDADCDNPFVTEEGLEMLVSIPLEAKGCTVGALTLGTRNPGVIVPEKRALLTAVSQQIGMAVENARLHKQLEQTAAIEERQRIAADMHDGLAQILSYLGLKTDRAAEMLEQGQIEPALEELPQMQNAIVQAIDNVRLSISSLQESPKPRQSLQNALAQLVENLTIENQPSINLQLLWETPLYLNSTELEQVLRIVQEALINALKHAKATNIILQLQKHAAQAVITIEDDGKGFLPDAVAANGGNHFGLSIMQARASRIKGQIEVCSNAGHGTQIRLTWPVKEIQTKKRQQPENIDLIQMSPTKTNSGFISGAHK